MQQPDERLKRLPPSSAPRGPVVLVVMDGVGIGRRDAFDAVATARTPNLDRLAESGLHREIFAHGPYVGLPSQSDMGNSEVGHNTMGAGRIVDQGIKRIDTAIESGAIWAGAWAEAVQTASQPGATLHLIGLLSDGGVHSDVTHVQALLHQASSAGLERVRLHTIYDGRDVPDRTAEQYADPLDAQLEQYRSQGKDYLVASGGGRMTTTMDRYEADWSIVENGWRAHVQGAATPFRSAAEAIRACREQSPGISDQLLPPFTVVSEDGEAVGPVRDGDAVILFNFRGDRSIELSRAFTEGTDFTGFDRGHVPRVFFAGMTLYDGDTNMPAVRLVEPPAMPGTVSERLSAAGVTQFACAETQKFGHVTYFWNGNRSDPFDEGLEAYVEISSDVVPFDQRPWMKSAETCDVVLQAIASGKHQFIRTNFAGGDMVGHTGSFEGAVLAVESVDIAVGRILDVVIQHGGCLVVTADHGNAEDMVERTSDGEPRRTASGAPYWKTAHSTNPVGIYVFEEGPQRFELRTDLPEAGLANLASTTLHLLGFEPPAEYAPSLLKPV